MTSSPITIEGCVFDMVAEAAAGTYSSLAGRERELELLGGVLMRRSKRNPLLLGEPGVGKTAVVEGFARGLFDGSARFPVEGTTLHRLCLGSLLSGTSFRGDLEERVRLLLAFLQEKPRQRLLFIDELHLLFRAGRSEGGLDVANLLKPLLARGSIAIIGASTPQEWSVVTEADPALARRFELLPIAEPDPALALEMLRASARDLSRHHGLEIPEGILSEVLALSLRRVSQSRLPDRAIDLLDDACVRCRRGVGPRPESVLNAEALEASRQAFSLRDYARHKWGDSTGTDPTCLSLEAVRQAAGLL